jgi:hypothetical protein
MVKLMTLVNKIFDQYRYRIYWYGGLLTFVWLMNSDLLFVTANFISGAIISEFFMYILSRGNLKTFESRGSAFKMAGSLEVVAVLIFCAGFINNIESLYRLGYMLIFAGVELIIFDSEIRYRRQSNASPA